MATVKSRFDCHPSLSASSLNDTIVPTADRDLDNPWIATYSKGLCSLYPREDDDCFDVLLSSQQQSNVYARQQQQNPDREKNQQTRLRPDLLRQRTAPAGSANTSQHHAHRPYHPRRRTGGDAEQNTQPFTAGHTIETLVTNTTAATTTTTTTTTNARRRSVTLESFLSESSSSSLLSPTRLSQTIAGWGFDCIDYFTRTRDDDMADEIEDKPSHSRFYDETSAPVEGARVLDDCRPVFAAVCGKRSAALTRKRALSRSQSQVSLADDPWLEAIDRLSRWDEVAYR